MRKALRAAFALLAAFLIQSTVLPYFKVNGVMLDLISITLITVGFALGSYAGVTAGLFGALLMEALTGDLGGLSAVSCVAAGAVGAGIAKRLSAYVRPGNRGREKLVKRLGPMVMIGLFVMGKESINVVYFYLTGVDIGFIHVFRMVLSGCWAALWSLPIMPALFRFLLRKPEDTLLAKWAARRRAKGKPEPLTGKGAKAGKKEKAAPAAEGGDAEPQSEAEAPETEAPQGERKTATPEGAAPEAGRAEPLKKDKRPGTPATKGGGLDG